MVLIALTILGAMTADLLETNEVYLATAVNTRDSKQAEYLAKSGINLARLTLSFKELLGNAANFPFWRYTDMVIPIFTSKDGGIFGDLTGTSFDKESGLGLKGLPDDADLQVTVVDEDSKMNINMANEVIRGSGAKLMMTQLSMLTASEAYDMIFNNSFLATDDLTEREDIICEFVDFSDADEDLCDMSGTEDRSLYTSLIPPYERKNAPLDSLEELRLISGVTDDFYSAFVDPKPDDPQSRIMTVWSSGRININTAPPQILIAVICDLSADENLCMGGFVPDNVLGVLYIADIIRNIMPFSNFKEFISLVENPGANAFAALLGLGEMPGVLLNKTKIAQQSRSFSTTSTVFSIYSAATVGRVTKRIHVVVDTKSEDQLLFPEQQSVNLAGGKVLYYRME